MHPEYRIPAQLAASPLVSLGRIGEAIAEYDTSFGKRGQNDFMNVLGAGSKHERQFCKRRKSRGGGVQQHVANLLAGGRASRFAGYGDRETVGAQGSCQFLDLRALAAAVEALKG